MVAAASIASAQVQRNIIIPPSSVEKPEDVGVRMHTNYSVYQLLPGDSPKAPPPGGTIETPGSIACIYDLVTSPVAGCPVATATKLASGGSETIVIVDAYDNPHPYDDLKTFDAEWGLRNPPTFVKKYANGTKPPNACASGWEGEEALDVQWAHAMAPKANIVLMEAASNSDSDLFAAVVAAENYIASHGGKGEISMSWGGSEFSTEAVFDVDFVLQPDIVYFASSGDNSGPIYPSASPFVVSVGATQINRNSSGNYTKQVGTKNCDPTSEGCGGGKSLYEGRPSYQDGVSGIVGSKRGTPDIASDSSSQSPVYVYDSSCYGGWLAVYGTSVASPTVAGIVNRAGLFKNGSSAELTTVYNNFTNASDYTDITSTSCTGHSAKAGYDLCTGVGVAKGYGKK
jgi:subtilase family serine protease